MIRELLLKNLLTAHIRTHNHSALRPRRSRAPYVSWTKTAANCDASSAIPNAASQCSAANKRVAGNAGTRLMDQSLPLEGESQKPSRPLSLSKGWRWLMRLGEFQHHTVCERRDDTGTRLVSKSYSKTGIVTVQECSFEADMEGETDMALLNA